MKQLLVIKKWPESGRYILLTHSLRGTILDKGDCNALTSFYTLLRNGFRRDSNRRQFWFRDRRVRFWWWYFDTFGNPVDTRCKTACKCDRKPSFYHTSCRNRRWRYRWSRVTRTQYDHKQAEHRQVQCTDRRSDSKAESNHFNHQRNKIIFRIWYTAVLKKHKGTVKRFKGYKGHSKLSVISTLKFKIGN